MAAKEKCPSCGAPVSPDDLLCANCERILDPNLIPDAPANRDLSVVRRLLEMPQPGLTSDRPAKASSPPRGAHEGPTRVFALARTSGVPIVIATLTRKAATLNELEAFVVSFIDGASEVDTLAERTGLSSFEVSVVLQALNEKMIVDFADEPLPPPSEDEVADELASSADTGEQEPPHHLAPGMTTGSVPWTAESLPGAGSGELSGRAPVTIMSAAEPLSPEPRSASRRAPATVLMGAVPRAAEGARTNETGSVASTNEPLGPEPKSASRRAPTTAVPMSAGPEAVDGARPENEPLGPEPKSASRRAPTTAVPMSAGPEAVDGARAENEPLGPEPKSASRRAPTTAVPMSAAPEAVDGARAANEPLGPEPKSASRRGPAVAMPMSAGPEATDGALASRPEETAFEASANEPVGPEPKSASRRAPATVLMSAVQDAPPVEPKRGSGKLPRPGVPEPEAPGLGPEPKSASRRAPPSALEALAIQPDVPVSLPGRPPPTEPLTAEQLETAMRRQRVLGDPDTEPRQNAVPRPAPRRTPTALPEGKRPTADDLSPVGSPPPVPGPGVESITLAAEEPVSMPSPTPPPSRPLPPAIDRVPASALQPLVADKLSFEPTPAVSRVDRKRLEFASPRPPVPTPPPAGSPGVATPGAPATVTMEPFPLPPPPPERPEDEAQVPRTPPRIAPVTAPPPPQASDESPPPPRSTPPEQPEPIPVVTGVTRQRRTLQGGRVTGARPVPPLRLDAPSPSAPSLPPMPTIRELDGVKAPSQPSVVLSDSYRDLSKAVADTEPPPPVREGTDPRIMNPGRVNRRVLDALKQVKRRDSSAEAPRVATTTAPEELTADRLAAGLLQVAIRMEQNGRLEEAIRYLETSISKSPDAPSLYNRLAIILMRERADLRRAEQLLQKAVELAPGNEVYENNLKAVLAKRAMKR